MTSNTTTSETARTKSFSRALKSFFVGCFVSVFMAATVLIVDGLTDTASDSDVIVVLGNEVLSDGTPSDRLAARLDKAHDLFSAQMSDAIIVSGGIGDSGYDEASVMANYLIDRGIPRSAIINDNNGINTRATSLNSAAIMRELGWASAIVVTQYFHISRSRLALHQAGIKTVTTAHADFFEMRDIYSIVREIPAYLKYRLE